AGRDIDGAESAGETAFFCPGPVDMTFGCALEEFRDRVASGFHRPPKPQEHVIVAVEHQFHGAFPDCSGDHVEGLVDPKVKDARVCPQEKGATFMLLSPPISSRLKSL